MKRFVALMWLFLGVGLLAFAAAPPTKRGEIPDFIQGADGLDDALRNLKAKMASTPVLTPQQALKHFTVTPGLAVDLIAHEPTVKQPLYLHFDERGRMWVVQYRQYPFPAGLKVVRYDRYIRAQFDKVPPPPPDQFPGEDRITIHEDTQGNGRFDKVTTFVSGLNIATAALPGRGGVWVLNPPYLLFYPDAQRTDHPGKPVVHLSGFGLEDTHAVASSLCWGPDGWIYGAQGSTCTAKVRAVLGKDKKTTDFLGQAIWRYHPEEHRFEIFAEGGGNTFGVAFDDVGRVFSGTNWGRFRGLHFVQGGYYIKGWGKHGPLTNPYALGFFDHMPHVGNADRLTHTFLFYGGTAIPSLRGKIIGVNALQRRVQVTQIRPDHSSFTTVEEPYLLTTTDERFRPVDVKSGPDGALYIADLYEPRINHVDPRDNWDRATGRIYRIRPGKFTPATPRDLGKATSRELVTLLASPSRWHRDTALRLLGDRKDRSLIPLLRKQLNDDQNQLALESLWALHACGGFDDATALGALAHTSPHVRRWGVRLIGDSNAASPEVSRVLTALARSEKNAQVRSQLASTAKRLPSSAALPIIAALWGHDEDIRDPHIPLLLWWALEAKMTSARREILKLFEDREVWELPLVAQTILPRMPQRWAMEQGDAALRACARLIRLASNKKSSEILLGGLENGFAGRASGELPVELRQAIVAAWQKHGSATSVTLGLRIGHEPALRKALAMLVNDKADRQTRLSCIQILGEIERPGAAEALLRTARESRVGIVRAEALGALQRYDDAKIGTAVLAMYQSGLPVADGVRGSALALLASRPVWTRLLLAGVAAKKIPAASVPIEIVHKLATSRDKDVVAQVGKLWGRVRGSTPADKKREILRVGKLLEGGSGKAIEGKKVFEATCGKCHKLFGRGGEVGPELTGYDRSYKLYWIENVVDPSAVIREEYMSFIVQTTDGRTLSGVVAGQDKTTVSLRDQEGRLTRLARSRIEDMRASTVSIMPEGQLKTLTDQQIRDLFAFLMRKKSP